ncbi:unnamed protein product [Paramecium pentaurelia]|uniref:Uncharacterized protein n=1 Tax=Paramecium pentaurelia TaxID=43138 RepID=A0A8S1TNI9_9CILI|nr:unnamed protein product [Paramecium pentaurelia]
MNNEITKLYRKLESFEHQLIIKVKIQLRLKMTNIINMKLILKDWSNNQDIHIIKQMIKMFIYYKLNKELLLQMKKTISLLKKQELDYYKKTIQNQINKLKVEYQLKIIEQQDILIQLTKSRNKEGSYFIKYFIH